MAGVTPAILMTYVVLLGVLGVIAAVGSYATPHLRQFRSVGWVFLAVGVFGATWLNLS